MANLLTRITDRSPLAKRIVNIFNPNYTGFPSIGEPDKKNISTVIVPVQLQRIKQDLQTWREALTNEVENAWYPQRVALQRLFYDVELDGHVKACMEKRRNLTLLRPYRFMKPNGQEDEVLTAFFKKSWFTSYLRHTIDARMFGYSLVKIGDLINGEPKNLDIVKRHNIFLGRQGENPVVTTIPYMISGTPFLEGEYEPWTCWIPSPSDIGNSPVGYGLLYSVALYAIIMRKLLGQNATYVELFGQPIRWAKTDKLQTDPEYAALINGLEQMGSTAYLVTDRNDEVALIETRQQRSGQNNPYQDLEHRCMNMVSKIILGHADAIDSPPGRSLGSAGNKESPSQVALAEIQASDWIFCMPFVNELLLPKLRNLGIPIPDGVLEPLNDDEKLEEQKKKNDINLVYFQGLVQAKAAGFETDEQTVEDATGIKVTKAAPVMPPMDENNGLTSEIKNKLEKIYA